MKTPSTPRTRLRRALASFGVTAAAAVVATVALVVPGASPALAGTVNGVRLNAHETALVAEINKARTAAGLAPLTVAAGTTDVARRWSVRLANAGTLSHNPDLGPQIEAAGSRAWTTYAENVGTADARDPVGLFRAYMASTGHRANILRANVRYLGIGTVERLDSTGGTRAWNTMVFVDAYDPSYGTPREPAFGMRLDGGVFTTTKMVAHFESTRDLRVRLGRSGTGLWTGRLTQDAPSTRDDALRFTVTQTAAAASGQAYVVLRDALDLRNARAITLRLAASTPTGRPVPVAIYLQEPWSRYPSVRLGTATLPSSGATVTLPVPAAAATFRNVLAISVPASSVSSISSTLSQRTTRIAVHGVRIDV